MLPVRIYKAAEPDLEAITSSEPREPEAEALAIYTRQSDTMPLFSRPPRLPSHSRSSSTSLLQQEKTLSQNRQTDQSRNHTTTSTTAMLSSISSHNTPTSSISSSPSQAPSRPASHTFTPPYAVFKATNPPPEPKLNIPIAVLPSRPKPIKQAIHELQRRSGTLSEHE